jgi:hypothetical protein
MKKTTLLPFLFCLLTSVITVRQSSVPTNGLVVCCPISGNLNEECESVNFNEIWNDSFVFYD